MPTLAERAKEAATEQEALRREHAIAHLVAVLGLHSRPGDVFKLADNGHAEWWTCDIDEYSFVFDRFFIQAARCGERLSYPRWRGADYGPEAGEGWTCISGLSDLAKVEI